MASDTHAKVGTTISTKWDVTTISPESRALLEQYSGIPPDKVIPHVENLRDKGYAIFPYPCIGQLRFLSLNLKSQPAYPEILHRLQASQNLLDVGTCFGQDVRKLIADGAPAEHIYGLDKEAVFIDLGYELFGDRKRLRSKFIAADITDPKADLSALEGKMDILFVSSFLHLWNWEDQLKVARRLVSLCVPKKGTLIVGRQLATTVPGEYPLQGPKQLAFRHNVESLKEFWKQVGEETGSEWKVEATLYMAPEVSKNTGQAWADPNMRMIQFSVVREYGCNDEGAAHDKL